MSGDLRMFYFLSIFGGGALIALLNYIFQGGGTLLSFLSLLALTFIQVAAVFIIDGILAFIIRRLPERWFSPEASAFSVGQRERTLYRRLGIRRWKRYVPEWGCFTGFHKDRLVSKSDREYLGRFLLESNYGVAGHIAGAVLGYLIMLLPLPRPLTVALPVAAVNTVLSLLPTAILRYNTPPLQRLYRRAKDSREEYVRVQ
jgi:hypothetical protein